LQKYLFDDYAFNPTTKKITRIDPNGSGSSINPMFVTMILDPIWQMYDVTLNQQNGEKAAKMAKRAVRQIHHGHFIFLFGVCCIDYIFHSSPPPPPPSFLTHPLFVSLVWKYLNVRSPVLSLLPPPHRVEPRAPHQMSLGMELIAVIPFALS
jgi:hypothetical protein